MTSAGTLASLGQNGTSLAAYDSHYMIAGQGWCPIAGIDCLAVLDTCGSFLYRFGLDMVAYSDFGAFVSCLHGRLRPY